MEARSDRARLMEGRQRVCTEFCELRANNRCKNNKKGLPREAGDEGRKESSLGDSSKGWEKAGLPEIIKKREKSWGQRENQERTKVTERFW